MQAEQYETQVKYKMAEVAKLRADKKKLKENYIAL